MSEQPHMIERLENLLASLDEIELEIEKLDIGGDSYVAKGFVSDAQGIAGELLTMIDGR